MADKTPLTSFFKDVNAHELLSKEQELELFRDIETKKKEICNTITESAVIYVKAQTLKDAIKVGAEDIKTFFSVYKHDLKMAKLKPYLTNVLQEYCDNYENYITGEGTKEEALQSLMKLKLEDSFIEECANEILSCTDETCSSLLIEESELHELQKSLKKNVRSLKISKDKIFNSNVRLVISEAKKYTKGNNHNALLDLVQEGSFGLMKSIDRFDYTEGNKFSTLATWWIKQSIIRSLQNDTRTIRIPVAVQDMYSKIQKYLAEMHENERRVPSEVEIAKYMNISTQRVREILDSQSTVGSTDILVGEDDDTTTVGDLIPDETRNGGYTEICLGQIKESINFIVDLLEDYEKTIINLRYGLENEPLSQFEVAAKLNISASEVREIEQSILDKLKSYLQELN